MAIPTPMDRKMAEIDDLAASVVIALRTMRFTPGHEVQLNEMLRIFVDAVSNLAAEIIASR